MYKVTSSSDYMHRISELTGVPMNTIKTIVDYLKLAVCHDVYNEIQINSNTNEDVKVNLFSIGTLTIKCDPITTDLSYSIDVERNFSKMIKDTYDNNCSPLTNKVEESVLKVFNEKFDSLGIKID